MSAASSISSTKPIRNVQTSAALSAPTKPAAPVKRIGRTRNGGTGSVIPFKRFPEPNLPPLSLALKAQLGRPRDRYNDDTRLTDETRATIAEDYIFHGVELGVSLKDIEAVLGLSHGLLDGWLVQTAERTTRVTIAFVQSADELDRMAREITGGFKVAPSSLMVRLALAHANSLRAAAEGRRRLSESLGRKIMPLQEERKATRTAKQKQNQVDAQVAAEATKKAAQRSKLEHMTSRVGFAPFTGKQTDIGADLSAPSSFEMDHLIGLELFDMEAAAERGDNAACQVIMDTARRRWRSELAKK